MCEIIICVAALILGLILFAGITVAKAKVGWSFISSDERKIK